MRNMTRVLLFAVIGLFAGLAQTQPVVTNTFEATQGPWNVFLGTSKLPGDHATFEACTLAANARAIAPGTTQRYGCRNNSPVVVTATVTCAPAPAASSTTTSQACPAGTTGGPLVTTVTDTYTVGLPEECPVVRTRTSSTSGVCTPVVVEPPPAGDTLYFSPTGDNAAPGTQAAPKRDLTGLIASLDSAGTNALNRLPAGSRLLFQRGGVWSWSLVELHNLRVTPENPLVIDAYGEGASPVFRTASGTAFQVGGRWGNTSNDGGYTIRNIQLDGMGTAQRGFWLVQNMRGLTLDNVDIRGFRFGIESSPGAPHNVTGLTIRNSRINDNTSMGILGSYSDSLIENSTFTGNNNVSGSTGNHAIYFSHGDRVTIRNNNFTGNSVVNGSCIGGNVTVHGVVDGLLIEGNTIRQERSAISCYGFAITAGYTTGESFRNVVVRGNTIINVGMTSIAANASPGILIEGNRVINTQDQGQYGIWIPANGGADAGDAAEDSPTVRNNTVCFARSQGSVGVSVNAPGAVVTGNVVRLGADSTTGACAQ